MTRETAKKIFHEVLAFGKARCTQAEFKELAEISIQALEQEPKSEWQKDHEILNAYSDGANEVLDKIRAEIKHFMYHVNPNSSESDYACNYILNIIDKLKGESEG